MQKYFFSTNSNTISIHYQLHNRSINVYPAKSLCEKYGITLLSYMHNHWQIINCWFSSKPKINIIVELSRFFTEAELSSCPAFLLILPEYADIENLHIEAESQASFKSIPHPDYVCTDLFQTNNLVFGAINWNHNKSFEKYMNVTTEEFSSLSIGAQKEFHNLSANTSGCYLEFITQSPFVHITAKLGRDREYIKIPFGASHGFDIYEKPYNETEFLHRECFAPSIDSNYADFEFVHNVESIIRIYLPLYNTIHSLSIETLYGDIKATNAPKKRAVFYGNSITQGASATRPGMSFVNILSQKSDWEIINYSLSSCCKAFSSIAHDIAALDTDYIFLDYSRNAWSIEELATNLSNFYFIIRSKKPTVPVIFLTTACFNSEILYRDYDNIINNVYLAAKANNESVYLINQKNLFTPGEYAICCNDGEHYTDYGMQKVANAILKLPL